MSSTLPHIYRCVAGSGIGLLHSAHVSNAMFFAHVEKPLFVDKPAGLDHYIRYHDDILSIHNDAESMFAFFDQMKARAAPVFLIVADDVSHVNQSVLFLDIVVHVVVPQLRCEANQEKPITPLCPTSCHQPSIHFAWPNAVCQRVHSLSDNKELALSLLVRRYVYANAHPLTTRLFSSWEPRRPKPKIESGTDPPNRAVFVLRYHPIFAKLFYRALHTTPLPPELNLKVLPAWKHALPSIATVVAKSNRRACNSISERREGRREGSLCVSNLTETPLRNFTFASLHEQSE